VTPEPAPAPIPGRILGVGIATLDLINEVERYPAEDAEVRALGQRRARGGNAANTLEVLSQLGHRCRWTGTLGDDAAADFIRADLTARGIDIRQGVSVPDGVTPTSYIALSRATGSRTIVHYRDLPELSAADFARVPLDELDWIHFEGRNPAETALMLTRARRDAPGAGLSVELEKDRPGIEALLDGPDLLLVSRAFVLARPGAQADPDEALKELARHSRAGVVVLAWGAQGAWLCVRGGAPQHCPALPPDRVLDTLGAGDVLNAGVIDGLLRRLAPAEAVSRAVRLAGIKCGRVGLSGLVDTARAEGFR
jgi:ketohexokinase